MNDNTPLGRELIERVSDREWHRLHRRLDLLGDDAAVEHAVSKIRTMDPQFRAAVAAEIADYFQARGIDPAPVVAAIAEVSD